MDDKKLFVYNQFILGFIILGLFIFPRTFSYEESNKYLVRKVNYTYQIYFGNNTYIISAFHGSGGWLEGGLISVNKISDINKISEEEISQIIHNDLDFVFSSKSFPYNNT